MIAFNYFTGYELTFLLNLLLCVIAGFIIGIEREARGKAAGVSTQSLVIGGSMMFTFFSLLIDPNEPARIAAQIVTGVGFLGAGIILKSSSGKITNLTTAASIWFSSAIGMAIGFQYYVVAIIATIAAVLIPQIPHLEQNHRKHDK